VRKQLRQGWEGEHKRDAGDQNRRGDTKEDHSVPHLRSNDRVELKVSLCQPGPPLRPLRGHLPASGEDIARTATSPTSLL
jgi:hypothetical protein